MRRTALLLGAGVLCAAVAHGHVPHDPVLAFAVSLEFARDRTIFVAVASESHFRYDDVLRSTNGGVSWQKLPAGLENRARITSLSVSPGFALDGAVVATTDGDGVFEYRADRAAWRVLNTGLPNLRVSDSRSARAPGGGVVAFAALRLGGLYANDRTAGGDVAWVPVLPTTIRVKALAISPDYEWDTTLATADAGGRLRVSRDGGRTWTLMGAPTGGLVHAIAIAPGFGSRREMFLTSASAGMYRSRDGGRTFTNVKAGLPDLGLAAVAVSPNYATDATVVCASLEKAVYKSVDRGDTWVFLESGAIDTNQSPDFEMKYLVFSPGYATRPVVFLAAYDGLFRSDNGGGSWREFQTRRGAINGVAISPGFARDGTVIVTRYGGEGLHASTDRGATWSVASGDIGRQRGHVYLMDAGFLPRADGGADWLASENHFAMWRTGDAGNHWQRIGLPSWPGAAISALEIGVSPDYVRDGTVLVATRWDGVLRSTDGGATWTGAREMVPEPVTSLAVSPDFGTDRLAFAGARDGGIWRSSDAGATWTRVGAATVVPLRGANFMTVAVSPDFTQDGLVLAGTNNGLYASRDRGLTWGAVGGDAAGPGRIVDQVRFSPAFARDRTVLVAVRGRGLYRCASSDLAFRRVGTALLRRHIQFTEVQISPAFDVDRTILGASRSDVYRSVDGGASWQRVARLTP